MMFSALRTAPLMLLIVLLGCSGRSAVISEMERYQPPSEYSAPTIPRPANVTKSPAQKMILPSLSTLKEQWEKVINVPAADTDFYVPDPSRLEALGKAISDNDTCEAALHEFSLETLEILVWARNPAVIAGKKSLKATLETYSQAANLEDILQQYSTFNASLMTGVGPMSNMESINKKFPYPGIIALKGEVVTQEVIIAREDLEIARRNALTAARTAYWDLGYARAALDTSTASLSLLRALESSLAKRYETGDVPVQEFSKVSVQKQKMIEEQKNLVEENRNGELKIIALLNLPSGAKIGTPIPDAQGLEIPSIEKLSELAIERRQELRKLRASITRMALMIEMAETEIYPGFSQNLSLTDNKAVTQAGTSKMSEPFAVSIEAGTGAGIPNNSQFGISEAYLNETREKLSALRNTLSGEEARTPELVQEAWLSADRAKRRYTLFKDQINSLSKLDIASAAQNTQSGAMSFSELIGSATALFETRLSIAKSKSELGRAVADLKEITGVSW